MTVAAGSIPAAAVPAPFIAPREAAQGNVASDPLPVAYHDLWAIPSPFADLAFSGEPLAPRVMSSDTFDAASIVAPALLSLGDWAQGFDMAAVYEGGGIARLPPAAADFSLAPVFEQRLAQIDMPFFSAGLPAITGQVVPAAARPFVVSSDEIRPRESNPDTLRELQLQGGDAGNVMLAGVSPPVAPLSASNAIATDRKAEPMWDAAERAPSGETTRLSADAVLGPGGTRETLADGRGEAVQSVLHDLLVPKLPADAAAISLALRDLFAEAEQFGTSLIDALADPSRSAELVVAAGVIAAGFAARQLSARESRERAERRQILVARFVAGPESVRLLGPKG